MHLNNSGVVTMANEEHLKILKQGVEAWNGWRQEHARIKKPDLSGANLRRVSLRGADLVGANLRGADLTGTNLYMALLSKADLSKANLYNAYLYKADLSRVRLDMADLRKANLKLTQIDRANLHKADFSQAYLSGAHLRGAYLSGANLSKADLAETDFSGADLSGANLSGANLWGTNLTGEDLRRADLFVTILNRANLRGVDLYEADLSGAQLFDANLSGANLSGANLHGVWVERTIFANVDLSEAKELDTVQYFGPSTIGIDTIFRSKGKIPKSFLRGCGVPDELINYLEKIKISECRFTREQLDLYIETTQNQLTIVIRNLGICREAQAKIGNKVDLELINQIKDLEEDQMRLETQLKEYKQLLTIYYPQE